MRSEPESERGNRREGQNKGREIVTSVEEVSKESGKCSRKGRVVVDDYIRNSVF